MRDTQRELPYTRIEEAIKVPARKIFRYSNEMPYGSISHVSEMSMEFCTLAFWVGTLGYGASIHLQPIDSLVEVINSKDWSRTYRTAVKKDEEQTESTYQSTELHPTNFLIPYMVSSPSLADKILRGTKRNKQGVFYTFLDSI